MRKILLFLLLSVSLPVFAQSDTEPPELVDFDFNPKSVDVTNASALVTFELTLTDCPPPAA